MANNKKWIIGGSITLLVLFGASLGIGAWTGIANKEDENYIKVYLNDTEYKAAIDLGTDSTSDETKASMLESQFYNAALKGHYNNSEDQDEATPTDSSIYGANESWALPYISTSIDFTKMQDDFVAVKFLTETENTSVYSFLTDLATTTENQLDAYKAINTLISEASGAGMSYPEVTGLDVLNNDKFSKTKTAIYNLIKEDTSYISGVQKDILVYTYLWQKPSQSAYDTIFTRELVYSQPSITYSMTLDGETVDSLGSSAAYDDLSTRDEGHIDIDAATWNGYLDSFKMDEVLVDDSIVDNSLPGDDKFGGYDGITFGTSAGSNISSNWTNWSNTYVAEDDAEVGTSSTIAGDYTNTDVLTNANLYLSDTQNGSDGEGAVIFNTSSDSTDPEFGHREGERNVYAYSQLYPFMFREVTSSEGSGEEKLGSEKFSLFANGDSTSGYTPVDDITTADNYIFGTWFGDESVLGEIYIAEQLVGYTSSLTSKALRYWNNQGYYIELSGDYEQDLASYLPEEILYDDEN